MTGPIDASSAAGRPGGGPGEELVHELIAARAARHPQRPAVVSPEGTLTYGELDRRATLLAADLRARVDAGPERLIGTCLRRGPHAVVALLGILKSGAAPVLTDPASPVDRITGLLRQSGVVAVVTASGQRGAPADQRAALEALGVSVVEVDQEWSGDAAQPFPRAALEATAHVVQTSGSSDGPKGVVARHVSVLQCVAWAREALSLSERDRTTWMSGPGYGVSLVNELWPALSVGATVHLPSDETLLFADRLRDWVIANRITVLQLTRTLAEPLWRAPWPTETDLRLLMVTGERLDDWPPDDLPFQVACTYGSTETTHITSWVDEAVGQPLDRRPGVPHVGRPVRDTVVRLLDPRGLPVPAGEVGEVHVAGPGVARGYLDAPALTAARWRPDPYSGLPGARMYRTGDLGRLSPDGDLELAGRADRQVKVRGQRVNLDEVEAAVRALPDIRETAVVARGDAASPSLVAYLVGVEPAQVAPVRAALTQRLPAAAVPGKFVLLDGLPRGATGKVDRLALPAPTPDRDSPGTAARTSDDVEADLTALWQRLLEQPRPGPDDNFFELGGHSMIAVHAVTHIEERWGVQLDLPTFYRGPTITEVAAAIRVARSTVGWLVRPADEPAPAAPSVRLLCFPYAGGTAATYAGWRDLLPDGVDVLAVQPPGRAERLSEPALRDLDALVLAVGHAVISDELTEVPTVFFGHSLGATVAFEVARWLQRTGHPPVARLIVSGASAPQVPVTARVHRLAEDEMWAHVEALGGTPAQLSADPQLRAVLGPTLRADFAAHETYRYRDDSPLECPITALAGEQDAEAPVADVDRWAEQTVGPFDRHVLPGGHFFVRTARDALLDRVRRTLDPMLTAVSS
ncbi:AMP-binding protein [Actinoplanes sp. NPDC051346]|uniref:AMP-binding protein n=1 Tax=Actinoplanes sp. NPDC051346 TaxID=3155048 RepID=UPI003423AF8C